MPVWTVKGGRHGEREERLLSGGLIGGGWEDLPDLSGIHDRNALHQLYVRSYPEASQRRASNHVGQLWSLIHRMQKGELVVLPVKTTGTIAVGRVAGDYQYRTDLGEDLRHVRPVEWIETDIPRDAFDQDLLYSFGAFLTFGRVNREAAKERIEAVLSGAHADVAEADESDEAEAESQPDVEVLAREQIRQFISRRFSGHEFAALIGEILAARGFTVTVSPPGADRGVDIVAGSPPMGLGRPRLLGQVKKGQAGIDEFRSLRGLVTSQDADHGLLVAWGGFKGTVRGEARSDQFVMRLWDSDEVLTALTEVYDKMEEETRTKLPLRRLWALVPEADD